MKCIVLKELFCQPLKDFRLQYSVDPTYLRSCNNFTTIMQNIALFPGSFDPMTIGHEDILRRALPLFDWIIIGIGHNSKKQSLFPLQQRLSWIESIFSDVDNIEVTYYEGLTVDFCKQRGIQYILRGLRNSSDFEMERQVAQLNHQMKGIETVSLITKPEYSHISSTIVREIYTNRGDISSFVPQVIANVQ